MSLREPAESKFTAHFRAALDSIDIASWAKSAHFSKELSFTKSMHKISVEEEGMMQAQQEAMHS